MTHDVNKMCKSREDTVVSRDDISYKRNSYETR